MPEAIYDLTTKKSSVDKSKSNQKKGYTPTYRITGQQLDKLIVFAEQDGFELMRKNKQGKPVRDDGMIAQTVRRYARTAIDEFIQAREGTQ